ncbi:hypothetical protein [Aeromicrobium sp.]|uniref:hypothetical protein n=1 Tax=Aeromicrobium sp. TaxID=1871063 RepID=UPI0019CECA3C|nr:hypothetical protein [Aeromicrobium sp.]MBC7630392.1 hypothetical protein [Aeromicrobium sp.]
MSRRRGLLAEVSWFQVAASVLAAVTAAFIASRLGIGGTIVGAALGSFVVTISTAFYGRTLDKGRTLLVTTASGTTIQRRVEDGDIAEAIEEVEEIDSPAVRAELVSDGPRRLHWKTLIVTSVVVLLLALAAISTYELVSGHTLDGGDGTTLGDTFGGSNGKQRPSPSPDASTNTPSPPATTSSPTAPASTTAPSPSASTGTPTRTASPTPAPTPTPTPAPAPTVATQ